MTSVHDSEYQLGREDLLQVHDALPHVQADSHIRDFEKRGCDEGMRTWITRCI